MPKLDQTFRWGDYEIAWGSLGKGAPLVMVHGTPFSSHVWHRIAPALAERFHVHFYDLPGYGQSMSSVGPDISLGIQNGAFAALLEHWNIDRPNVLAHDFGGATVLRAHFLDGCEYNRLILFDPVALRPWGSPFVQHVRKHETAFAGMPDYIQRAVVSAYIGNAVHRTLNEAEMEPYIAPWLGETGQPAFYRQIAQMDQRYTDEVQNLYSEIRCPVRLLWGADDAWIPPERGFELAAAFDCELTVVPECGHLMQEDQPDTIVAVAREFLAA